MNLYDIDDIQQGNQGFIIDSDSKADWACKVIKSEQAETERLINAIDEEIEMLEEKKKYYTEQCCNKTAFLKNKLANYFETVEKKELKTCYKYKLPSADLVFMKPSVRYERDNDKILSWLTEHSKFEFIKTNPSVDWAELKKTDFFKDIDGITEVMTDAEFKIS
jgi:phage host-nuclease inhibitor protein Gam